MHVPLHRSDQRPDRLHVAARHLRRRIRVGGDRAIDRRRQRSLEGVAELLAERQIPRRASLSPSCASNRRARTCSAERRSGSVTTSTSGVPQRL